MKIKELVRPNILALKPYSSARDEYSGVDMINLDANENPFDNGLNRYPDPYQRQLKEKIANWKGMSSENLILGNGSDEIIDLIMRAFGEPKQDSVLTFSPTYGMYSVSAEINGLEYISIPLKEDFSIDLDLMIENIKDNTKLIFICSPNNPTGNTINQSDIMKLMKSFKGIVVIDEAYIDFSTEESWIKRLNNCPQLIVLQTFSKCFGLAGIRLGLGWASTEIIEILNKIKPPYNVNELTQQRALDLLEDTKKIDELTKVILSEKQKLSKELSELPIVQRIYPSEANFLLVKMLDADNTYNYLIGQGIVVRNRSNVAGCDNCLRISIGKPEENEILIKKLKEY